MLLNYTPQKFMDESNALLCDFHIHTHFSDGALSVRDTIDLYGSHGFDVIAITDHIVNENELKEFQAPNGEFIGILLKENFSEYIATIKKEALYAWQQYQMLVMPGAEFTNNYGGFHLVGLDVESYFNPGEPIEKIISHIHMQNGLAIAAHPIRGFFENNSQMTFLWKNRKELEPLIDAWEVANRFEWYKEVAESGLKVIGNSDFHGPAHLFSWKTLLGCEKNVEDVKRAIVENKNVKVRFYKEVEKCKVTC